MTDHTQEFSPEDVQKSKSLAWLSYFGIFLLIPLLVNKDSAYTKFHCNQGLILFILVIILNVLSVIPYVGIVFSLLSLVVGIFDIMGIVFAATGKAKELPLIGKIKLIK